MDERLNDCFQKVLDAGVPGFSIVVTDRTGDILSRGVGKLAFDDPRLFRVDTPCHVFSLGKSMAAMAALKLWEDGVIDLHAPAAQYLPRIGSLRVLEGYDERGMPKLRPPKRDITVHDMLTHTAGMAYPAFDTNLAEYMERTGMGDIINTYDREECFWCPLVRDPGEKWQYSPGLDITAMMVAHLTEMSYEAFLRKHFLDPLGMKDTTFHIKPEQQKRMAGFYFMSEKTGKYERIANPVPYEPHIEAAGAAMCSTAADYIKYLRMILNKGVTDSGVRVLEPETVELACHDQVSGRGIAATPRYNHLAPGKETGWAYSFQYIKEDVPRSASKGTICWAGASNVFYWADPVKGVAGCLTCQVMPYNSVPVVECYDAIRRATYDYINGR
ncbi:hypothetical protein CANCADRAFT_732 [Tortispora caseinolytica NRRL Y-17796]|uniref:Beta-lactamase-related domain-containing protein n=1 Tax=Tortispora caseinolytica NRRL Y-17796 TaxID=767744 RepID=A0A1E4TK88_9ASCO|nr:hypothetical protein CANCADRAFT_732 [Tortispora caseinolytica NRRL Y-17796]